MTRTTRTPAGTPTRSVPSSARQRRVAWVLVVLVLGTWLGAAVAAGTGLAPRAGSTSTTPGSLGPAGAGPVVVIGVPGLTWDLVSPERTPALLALAEEGGAAALVLRGTHEVTCSPDAWLTLGAGQRASTDLAGCVGGSPGSGPSQVDQPLDPARWSAWSSAAEERAIPARLGLLADSVEAAGSCVAAYGPQAALGAARGDGTVAIYVGGTAGVLEAGSLSPECRVHLVSVPPVADGDGSLADVDAALGSLARHLPEDAALLVAGMGHTDGRPETQVLVVDPSDGSDASTGAGAVAGTGATLTSGSTLQRSLVQLTDLTATVLTLAGAAVPPQVGGQPVTASAAAGGEEGAAAAADLAAGIDGAKRLLPRVAGTLAVLVLPVLGVALLLGRRRRVAAVGTFVMALPVATFTAGWVPWWSAARPWPALTTAIVAGALAVAALAVLLGRWLRSPLLPAAVVAAVSLAVLGADVLCSARLGLVSVLGLQTPSAGRFYGQGNVGFGIVLGSFLVLSGALLTWVRGDAGHPDGQAAEDQGTSRLARAEGAALVTVLGLAAAAVNAAPQGGADFGGVPALVVATGLLALAALGVRWSPLAVLGLAVVGVLVAAGVMVLDWARGPGSRTHLGDFVDAVLHGEAWGIVTRKLDQSLGILVDYPLSWIAVLALVVFALAVVRRPAWSPPLWGLPGLRQAGLAGLVAMVLGWGLNDSGIAVVALALTMLISGALTLVAPARVDAPPDAVT